MALEEVSFYTITGDEINITNLVNQMVDYYQQKLEVGETKLTDFNEGSEIRNILEAFAVGMYAILEQDNEESKMPFISLSDGTFLDLIGENPFINLARIEGAEATGEVTFTLAEAQETDFVIPADTLLIDSYTGLEFVTDIDCIISIGETTGDVSVTCLTTGTDGNCASGDLNIISEDNTGLNLELLSVTNTDAFDTGTDYEDDEAYRQRLLDNVQADGFGTLGYYTRLCEDIKGVHDVLFVVNQHYTREVLVNGYTKPVEDSVVLDVLTALSDTNNKVLNHTFTADAVDTTSVNFTLNLNVTSNIDSTSLLQNLTAFVNGTSFDRADYTGLNINEPLTMDGIVECLSIFPEFISATGVYEGSSFTSLSPDSNTVIKLGTVTFNQTVV